MLFYNKLIHPILAPFIQACKIFIDVLRDDTVWNFLKFQRRHVVLFEDIDIDSNTSSFWIKSRGSNQWSHFNQHVSFPRAFIVVKANGLLVSAPTGHGQTSTTLPDISESKTFSIWHVPISIEFPLPVTPRSSTPAISSANRTHLVQWKYILSSWWTWKVPDSCLQGTDLWGTVGELYYVCQVTQNLLWNCWVSEWVVCILCWVMIPRGNGMSSTYHRVWWRLS